ncbi:MAG: hypothetical protein IJ870_00845, partial [Alphaproteobacteria bacterium]|nr:hypothetical protein [Alphaproteobacteria bacterium]
MRKSSRFILALMATTSLETANALAAECPEGRCPSRYTCQCDSAGRITEQVDTRTSRTTVIEYDNQGNRTSSTIYNSAEAVANNTPTSQTRYTYDANGKQTSSTSYNN